MKYTFVGDVHGRWEAVEEALTYDGTIVFVGDFMDSFDRSAHDMARSLDLALDAADAGKAVILWGNHELSYVRGNLHRCSGYSHANASVLEPRLGRIRKHFRSHFLPDPRILVTHAGLHPKIWEQAGPVSLDRLDDILSHWWEFDKTPAHWIGHSRGGPHTVGGIFWCDFNREFETIPGLMQVFGHTQGDGVRVKTGPGDGSGYCVDCIGAKQPFMQLEL